MCCIFGRCAVMSESGGCGGLACDCPPSPSPRHPSWMYVAHQMFSFLRALARLDVHALQHICCTKFLSHSLRTLAWIWNITAQPSKIPPWRRRRFSAGLVVTDIAFTVTNFSSTRVPLFVRGFRREGTRRSEQSGSWLWKIFSARALQTALLDTVHYCRVLHVSNCREPWALPSILWCSS